MIACIRSRLWLLQHFDGPTSQPAWLAYHLERCSACRKNLAAHREAAGLLSSKIPQSAPSPWLASRITAAARSSATHADVGGQGGLRILAVSAVGASLLAVGWFGWFAFSPASPSGALPPTTSTDLLAAVGRAFSVPVPPQLATVAGGFRNPLEVELRSLASDTANAWQALKTDLVVAQP